MKFSIVIPLYNKAPYIKETLQSLVDQKKLPHELIIVDDKSTDDSLKHVMDFLENIPSHFNEVKVEIIELEKNYGIGYARNIGFSKTTGDVVGFLDADDIYAPGLIHTADVLMSSHEIDFLVFGIRLFPSNTIYPDVNKLKGLLTQITSQAYSIKRPLKTITSHHFYMGVGSNVIAKRECMAPVKFIEKIKFYEGIDYWYRVLKVVLSNENNNVGLLMGGLLNVREVQGSASRKKYERWDEIDFPPVLSRYEKSKNVYDKLLMEVVGKRWLKHAVQNLNSIKQKLIFIFKYRVIYLKQMYYFVLRKFQ